MNANVLMSTSGLLENEPPKCSISALTFESTMTALLAKLGGAATTPFPFLEAAVNFPVAPPLFPLACLFPPPPLLVFEVLDPATLGVPSTP